MRLLHRLSWSDCLTGPLASKPAPENPESMGVECDLLKHSLNTEGAAVGGVEASLGDEVSLEDKELELPAV